MKNIAYNVARNCYVNEHGQEVDPKTGRVIGPSEAFTPPEPPVDDAYAVATDTLVYKILNKETGKYYASPTPQPLSNYRQVAIDIVEEIVSARKNHGPIASAHEGYAIMLEEMDEVKEHVWVKQKLRDQSLLRKELVQLAAMAVAMIVEIADADNRR